MKSSITDRMKKNKEIGRIAMLRLRLGCELSQEARRLVVTTIHDPEVGRELLEQGGDEALSAIWLLDDAEHMSAEFSAVEEKAKKLDRALNRYGYELVCNEASDVPLAIAPAGEDVPEVALYMNHETKDGATVLTFGAKMPACEERDYTQEEAKEAADCFSKMAKMLKTLNGIELKGSKEALRLAVYSVTDKKTVNKGKARRAALKKTRHL